MPRPTPPWLERALSMQPEEIIVIQTDVSHRSVKKLLSAHSASEFAVKDHPNGFKIIRK